MSKWASKEEFKGCVRRWAEKLDIEVKTISLRPMRRKWASYSRRNDLLIFNSELLAAEKEIGEHVIVHELLHFRVPNHGKLWKSLMAAHLGNYEAIEAKLEEMARGRQVD
jgi:predicted metal-dependent hydrolase